MLRVRVRLASNRAVRMCASVAKKLTVSDERTNAARTWPAALLACTRACAALTRRSAECTTWSESGFHHVLRRWPLAGVLPAHLAVAVGQQRAELVHPAEQPAALLRIRGTLPGGAQELRPWTECCIGPFLRVCLCVVTEFCDMNRGVHAGSFLTRDRVMSCSDHLITCRG